MAQIINLGPQIQLVQAQTFRSQRFEAPPEAQALQLCVEEGAKDGLGSRESDMGKLLADQSFVSSILASLPGVDPNVPLIKDLLASMQNQLEFEQKKEEDKALKEDDK
ncbi:unnamed protein product [Lactuca saligna]|uniref:Uncharacterized protein n=1 Tax=Lactuca saligna TaxID=75948 RepID=A0AA35ZR60_LACSI|nr:unnamed protein product [Lactuca saligna]